jgi:DNA-binding FadR family transcriptional regulator
MFGPVVRESASSACAGRIRAAILRGEVAPGSRLPPERELAATFGVNRGTLRSALHELELAGLLSVLHGSGYSVRDFRETGGPALVPALADLARESGDFVTVAADLLHVRRALAAALVERLAAEKIAKPALRAIEAAIAAFEELAAATPRASTSALAEADLRVVRALVAATGSAVLGLFVNPDLREAIYADPAENVAGYRLVLEALRQGALPKGLVAGALESRDQSTLRRLERRRAAPNARRTK